jgi:hypothetical protein
MAYEVWDMRTGNLVASFGIEEHAMGLVRDAAEAHGDEYVQGLALVREDENGTSTTVATAGELLRRVRVVSKNGRQAGPGQS